MKGTHKQIRKAIILLFWLGVWQAAALWAANPILLAGPVQVLCAFVKNLRHPDFSGIIVHSLTGIGMGFFLAFIAGILLGAFGYRMPWASALLSPVMAVLKSVPVASFVVLLLIWFGSGRLSFWISFLIVFPNVYVNTIAGLRSTDEKLLEMARLFEMGSGRKFFYIYRPALTPHLRSCLKISLGMSWKSGVAAEIIGLPEATLGERLYMSKIYLDTAGLFAWTMTIVLVSFLFEKVVLWLFQKAAEWRPYPGRQEGASMKRKLMATALRTRCAERTRAMLLCASAVVERTSGSDCDSDRDDRGSREEGDGKRRNMSAPEEGRETGSKIRMLHIDKFYNAKPVLQDCSVEMEAGGRYLLMAPSGAGKTTLLRILTGLEQADRGAVQGMPGHIGMVFQEDRLCEEYDAVCNIMLGMGRAHRKELEASGLTGGRLTEYVRAQAARILPEDCLTKPVGNLSGGMRRRVSLLRAVLSGADILILDEPFTGLDAENRERCAQYLTEQLRGRTLIATTHREEDVALLQGRRIYFY